MHGYSMRTPAKLCFTLGEIECTRQGMVSVTVIADQASATKAHKLLSESLTGVSITPLENHAFRISTSLPGLNRTDFHADRARVVSLAVDILGYVSAIATLDIGMECVAIKVKMQDDKLHNGMRLQLKTESAPSPDKREVLALFVNDLIDGTKTLENAQISNITGGVHTELMENGADGFIPAARLSRALTRPSAKSPARPCDDE